MRWLAALALFPGAALADPVQGTGYLTTCIDDSCEVVVGQTAYWVTAGDGTETDLMLQLYEAAEGVVPVEVAGEANAEADLVLSQFTFLPPDAATTALTAAQGLWVPLGDGSTTLTLKGLVWKERQDGKDLAEYRIVFGTACADGADRGGLVLSLRDDAAEAQCWQLAAQDEGTLTLRQLAPGSIERRFQRP